MNNGRAVADYWADNIRADGIYIPWTIDADTAKQWHAAGRRGDKPAYKRPLLSHGEKAQLVAGTLDWRELPGWANPACNGASMLVLSGWGAIDVDDPTLAADILRGVTVATGLAYRTPGGGYHYWFKGEPPEHLTGYVTWADHGTEWLAGDRHAVLGGSTGYRWEPGDQLPGPLSCLPACNAVLAGLWQPPAKPVPKPVPASQGAADSDVVARLLAVKPFGDWIETWRPGFLSTVSQGSGGWHRGACPVHTPGWEAGKASDFTWTDDGTWKCHGPGTPGGGLLHLYAQIHGMVNLTEVARYLADRHLEPRTAGPPRTRPADHKPKKTGKKRSLTPEDLATLIAESGRVVRYNTAAAEYEQAPTGRADDIGAWEELTNRRLSHLCNQISGIAGQVISEERALRLLATAADEWDPFAHWLDALPAWDQQPRLDRLADDLWAVTEPRLSTRFGYCLLGAMIARTREPGAKADDVWILASRGQGIGKTTFAEALFPPFGKTRGWVVGGSVDIGDAGSKRFLDQIRPARLVELADIDGVSARDWSKVKAFVSASSDSERLAYDRRSQAMPRIPVFLGTSDKGGDALLPLDPAGQRRWRILSIGPHPDFDSRDLQRQWVLERIAADRGQLWAEAAHRFAAGEQYWLDDDDSALAEMIAMCASHSDTITEAIQAGGLTENSHLTVAQIAEQIGLTNERRPHPAAADVHTITRSLKQIGLTAVRKKLEGRVLRVWVPAETGFNSKGWELAQRVYQTGAERRRMLRGKPADEF